MKTTVPTDHDLHILLVGNNPIDLSRIIEKIDKIPGTKIITEIAFDLRSSLERLVRFQPNFILIDDNIGREQLKQTVEAISHSEKTKDVPVALLKNSNYQESGSSLIQDYLLKNNLTPETLRNAVKNALRFKRTQRLLRRAYSSTHKVLFR